MSGNCSACNILIDINNYKKNRTVCKTCYKKTEEKTIITIYPQVKLILITNNKLLKTLTILFQHTKVMLGLLSAQET